MRGNKPTIRDVELELEELVLPVNLMSNESLSPDDPGAEEEPLEPYKIDTSCGTCSTGVRLVVGATRAAIRTIEVLLTAELSLLCPTCARNRFRHGRT